MATYSNDYDKKSDYIMWELHEIRHKIQKEKVSIERMNSCAKSIVNNWKRKNLTKQST